ncbi:MAG: hypothetical protein ACR2OC_09500 [Solirubrobacterales bacterium]
MDAHHLVLDVGERRLRLGRQSRCRCHQPENENQQCDRQRSHQLSSASSGGSVSSSHSSSTGPRRTAQGCASCHGAPLFTSSIKDFVSPPAAAERFTERSGTFTGNPVGNEYLNRFLTDINSFNLGVPGAGNDIGNNIGATEKASSAIAAGVTQPAQDGLGKDYNADGAGIGFSPQSLIGIGASPPYYHNGACETLACVLSDVQHRTGKGARPDILTNSADRAKVETFLNSIGG